MKDILRESFSYWGLYKRCSMRKEYFSPKRYISGKTKNCCKLNFYFGTDFLFEPLKRAKLTF